MCERFEVHDVRAKNIEAALLVVQEAQGIQAKALVAQAESHAKTQEHLEEASKNLEVATKTLALSVEQSNKWQSWAMKMLTKSTGHILAENWKVIVALTGALGTLVAAIVLLVKGIV